MSQTYTTKIISQQQIIYFASQISGFDECKYFVISDGSETGKWDLIRVANFWKIYKQFKTLSAEKLDRICLARGIITIGDWCDFITETKAYGAELRHMFPHGKASKVGNEWRFYFN